MYKRYRFWILRILSVILVLSVGFTIYSLSSQNIRESAAFTGSKIRSVCEKIYPGYNEMSRYEQTRFIKKIHDPIRKVGHMVLFFILGSLVFLNVVGFYKINIRYRLIISFAISLLFAAGDEFHQLFVYGRAGSIVDVLIDSVGIIAALFLWNHIFKKQKVKIFFGMED